MKCEFFSSSITTCIPYCWSLKFRNRETLWITLLSTWNWIKYFYLGVEWPYERKHFAFSSERLNRKYISSHIPKQMLSFYSWHHFPDPSANLEKKKEVTFTCSFEDKYLSTKIFHNIVAVITKHGFQWLIIDYTII